MYTVSIFTRTTIFPSSSHSLTWRRKKNFHFSPPTKKPTTISISSQKRQPREVKRDVGNSFDWKLRQLAVLEQFDGRTRRPKMKIVIIKVHRNAHTTRQLTRSMINMPREATIRWWKIVRHSQSTNQLLPRFCSIVRVEKRNRSLAYLAIIYDTFPVLFNLHTLFNSQ